MKISEAIATLREIKRTFVDIAITGGYMADDRPLAQIIVTDTGGGEIWPGNPNGGKVKGRGKVDVDGVFIT